MAVIWVLLLATVVPWLPKAKPHSSESHTQDSTYLKISHSSIRIPSLSVILFRVLVKEQGIITRRQPLLHSILQLCGALSPVCDPSTRPISLLVRQHRYFSARIPSVQKLHVSLLIGPSGDLFLASLRQPHTWVPQMEGKMPIVTYGSSISIQGRQRTAYKDTYFQGAS